MSGNQSLPVNHISVSSNILPGCTYLRLLVLAGVGIDRWQRHPLIMEPKETREWASMDITPGRMLRAIISMVQGCICPPIRMGLLFMVHGMLLQEAMLFSEEDSGAAILSVTSANGQHSHNVGIGGAGAHSHTVSIGAHSHTPTGTISTSGSGAAISVANSLIKFMG